MSFSVVVPPEALEQIASWELPPDLEEQVLDRLAKDLEYGHEHTCARLPAPSPTFVYCFELPDPVVPTTCHLFTFHLTYGPADDTLYVYQAFHQEDVPGQGGPPA